MRRRRACSPVPTSEFAGFRFPPEMIVLAVRWYLRYALSYRDVTDRAPVYPRILDELLAEACYVDAARENNRIEADHGRLKARLRPMRGLKRLRSVQTISAGHALVQNIRRGHYELGIDTNPQLKLAAAFTELAAAV
ncbi:DDE-type integrase/transposase/recombinase [Frankia sp. ACN1ag]|uniref:DDE-type integrase/transposase/recombinase n=1 Tax=Frankia sp. ACN1ag TaxID=102891 RepID=UPI0006DBDFF7|nr:DDE-type integrase/transposase/recombinase [Frankia sp. ACN1ag]KQC37868.1 transposase [Frankia sp. ACN1ag]